MNATTLSLSAFALVLGAVLLCMFAVWCWRFPWIGFLRAIPDALTQAWYGSCIPLGLALLVFVLAILGTYRFPMPETSRYVTPPDGFWLVPAFTAMFSGLAVIIMLLTFVAMFVDAMKSASSGLDVVYEQRIYDTGNYAKTSNIDAALRDEDELGTVVPEFDE